MLAGVHVPWEAGSLGHSDADVVLHALTDALLGAMALGDIGEWFPDSDPRWKDADSATLLTAVLKELSSRKARPVNVDVTVYLERPKLLTLKAEMRKRLAEIVGLDASCVGLKARTFEGFGAIGKGDAVAATAVVLVEVDEGAAPSAE
jgi:2-C-methyl-D-erythritol 2,4-cyclodiphosphate synthase